MTLSGPNKQYVAPDSSHDEGMRLIDLKTQNDILKTALRNLISVCKALDVYNRYKALINAAVEALEGK